MGTLASGIILLLLAAILAITPRTQTLAYKLTLLALLSSGGLALHLAREEPAARAKAEIRDRDDVCNKMGERVSAVIRRHDTMREASRLQFRSFLAHAIRVDSAAIGELFQTMKTVCLRPASSCDALIERLSSEEHPLSEGELRVLMRAFERQQGCEAVEPSEG